MTFHPQWQAADWQQLVHEPTTQAQAFILRQDRALPPQVKQATLLPQQVLDQLPDRAFGLILVEPAETLYVKGAEHRLFPLTDMNQTYLQMEALRFTGERLPPDARKVAAWHIGQAALRHGIPLTQKIATWREGMTPCSNRVLLAPAEPPTEAAPPSDERLWGMMHAGQPRYPLHTADLIKQAMDYLGQYEHDLTVPQRYTLATNIARRAAEENIGITEKVAEYTYDGTYGVQFAPMVAARTDYAVQHQPAAVPGLLAIGRAADGGLPPWETAEKMARWDQQTGYDQYAMGLGLNQAHQDVLGTMTPKQASLDPATMRFSDLDDRQIAGLVLRHQAKLGQYLGQGTVRQLMEHPRAMIAAFDEDQQDAVKMILAGQL